MAEMTDGDELSKRAAQRDSLFLAADLCNEAGQPVGSARIRNLSASGMMADCGALLREGDRIKLALRNIGDVAATISWVRDGRIGATFDRAIDPKLVRRPVGSGAAQAGYPPISYPAR